MAGKRQVVQRKRASGIKSGSTDLAVRVAKLERIVKILRKDNNDLKSRLDLACLSLNYLDRGYNLL